MTNPIPDLRMKKTEYGIYRSTRATFEEAVQRTRDALQAEGFGIITEIDARATFKKKLDVDFPNYVILGACAPKLAHEALSTEPDIGLLLPCNVTVHDAGNEIQISAIKPTTLFNRLVQNPDVSKLADDVEARLTRALDRAIA
ncbi:MAG: DUF302 domain-containing protein [Candidatus Thermoplasmatota archaeon]